MAALSGDRGSPLPVRDLLPRRVRPFPDRLHQIGTMSQFEAIDVPAEVISAARAGDAGAYEAIYRACRQPLYTLIRRIISRQAIADELFQETFVEILRHIRDYSGEGAFGGWVRTIAVNKCLMHLRSPWIRRIASLDDALDDGDGVDIEDHRSGPEEQATASIEVERALASLSPLSRAVVWLHDVEGYTHGEIARALGRTVSFSKSQLARAHMRLRAALEVSPRTSVESLSCTQASETC
jgi:RNA polymerase sigma-70 factor (ECF subfamily)